MRLLDQRTLLLTAQQAAMPVPPTPRPSKSDADRPWWMPTCQWVVSWEKNSELGGVNTYSEQWANLLPGKRHYLLSQDGSLSTEHWDTAQEKSGQGLAFIWSKNVQGCLGLMADCLSQHFLILQWVTFDSIINQIQGTKSLNTATEYYSILISSFPEEFVSHREISPKEPKLPYSSQDPLQKILRPLLLSLTGSQVGTINCRRGLAARPSNSCHPSSPKQTSQSSNNSPGFCSQKQGTSLLSCLCRCVSL